MTPYEIEQEASRVCWPPFPGMAGARMAGARASLSLRWRCIEPTLSIQQIVEVFNAEVVEESGSPRDEYDSEVSSLLRWAERQAKAADKESYERLGAGL